MRRQLLTRRQKCVEGKGNDRCRRYEEDERGEKREGKEKKKKEE